MGCSFNISLLHCYFIVMSSHKWFCTCCVALGQVMLYVDGMNGVIAHNATVQWLYSLINCSVSFF